MALRPTIEVRFDDVMDTSTLTPANVELYRTSATPAGVTVTPALNGRSGPLEPTTRLKAGR